MIYSFELPPDGVPAQYRHYPEMIVLSREGSLALVFTMSVALPTYHNQYYVFSIEKIDLTNKTHTTLPPPPNTFAQAHPVNVVFNSTLDKFFLIYNTVRFYNGFLVAYDLNTNQLLWERSVVGNPVQGVSGPVFGLLLSPANTRIYTLDSREVSIYSPISGEFLSNSIFPGGQSLWISDAGDTLTTLDHL